MSRVNLEATVPGREVVVGLDSICGFFLQVFEDPKKTDGEEELVVDADRLSGYSRGRVMELIKIHAAPSDKRDKVISLVAMDLDPATESH